MDIFVCCGDSPGIRCFFTIDNVSSLFALLFAVSRLFCFDLLIVASLALVWLAISVALAITWPSSGSFTIEGGLILLLALREELITNLPATTTPTVLSTVDEAPIPVRPHLS